jgi:hypothetical protein
MQVSSLEDDPATGGALDTGLLLREARQAREDAARLLGEFRILEKYQRYGAVDVAGSYRWDLMLRDGDVDLFVVNPSLDLELALDACTRFVREGDFLRFGFIDSVREKPAWADPQTYPTGFYLGMARHFAGREWKVETWLLAAPSPIQDWILEKMTDTARAAILRLKQLRRAGGLRAGSYDIYRAVLLGGARSPAEVERWLALEGTPAAEATPAEQESKG